MSNSALISALVQSHPLSAMFSHLESSYCITVFAKLDENRAREQDRIIRFRSGLKPYRNRIKVAM